MTEPVGPTDVVVLAAGSGTRMRSRTAKVLHALGGRSMVGHVLAAANELEARRVVVVVGHGREQVGPHVRSIAPTALLAVQEEQLGTGHAVSVAVEALDEAATQRVPEGGTVVVLSGDTPLLEGATLRGLLADHQAAGRAVTLLTGEVAQPRGYGRIVRDHRGGVVAIVEEKDATEEQRALREINAGIYAFDAVFLRSALKRPTTDNAQGEYYLTDAIALAVRDGLDVGGHCIDDMTQAEGANDRVQLADLAAKLNRRTLERWMRHGVSVADPATTWVDVTVQLEPDVTILPGGQLLGATTVAHEAVIGPDSTLVDVEVGAGATVTRTHAVGAMIGSAAQVGPFVHLRPGARVAPGSRVEAFEELGAD